MCGRTGLEIRSCSPFLSLPFRYFVVIQLVDSAVPDFELLLWRQPVMFFGGEFESKSNARAGFGYDAVAVELGAECIGRKRIFLSRLAPLVVGFIHHADEIAAGCGEVDGAVDFCQIAALLRFPFQER